MSSTLNWKEIGRFVAALVKLFTTITSTFKKVKVGPEIIEWLNGPGKDIFVGNLEGLAGKFVQANLSKSPGLIGAPSVPEGQKWMERDGVIHFVLPASEGITGQGWIDRLDAKGKRVSDDANAVLRSSDFQPTPAGFVHQVVVLRATFWKDNSARTTKAIQAEGVSREWLEIHPEAVCIIREYFTDKELKGMGLWWIVGIHKPIEVDGDPHFLDSNRIDDGDWLNTRWAYPDDGWPGHGAFAFGLPQGTRF